LDLRAFAFAFKTNRKCSANARSSNGQFDASSRECLATHDYVELEFRLVQCVRSRRIKFVEFGFEACLDVPEDRPEKK
jgi:hypothetical protein